MSVSSLWLMMAACNVSEVESRGIAHLATETLQQARLLQPMSQHVTRPWQTGPSVCL